MFGVGLGLLGLFNPNTEIEVEEGIIAPLRETWDVFNDTSSWKHWKIQDGELEWTSGRPGKEGTQYTIIRSPEVEVEVSIIESHIDSLLILESRYSDGTSKVSSIGFAIENGQTMVSHKEILSTTGFLQRVNLSFNRSSIEKQTEEQLEALKVYMEKGE